MKSEAFSRRIREKQKANASPDIPQNKVDRIVEHMIKQFNHLTRKMNDSQRMVTARILANDLNAIDVEPRRGGPLRYKGKLCVMQY